MKITFSKNALSNMKIAYKRIFGLSDKDLTNPEHQKAMESALGIVWKYSGNFEDEPDLLANKRRALTAPAEGNVAELATHFKMLYPGKYSKLSSWDIIYTMYARMNSSEQDETVEPVMNEVEETTAEQSLLAKDDSDITNVAEITVNSKKKKEKENMKNIVNERATEGKIDINTLRGAGTTAGSNVKVSVNMDQAAREELQNTLASRRANTEGSTVTRIILSSKPQSERLEKGEATKGHITESAWQRVYDKFVKNTGYDKVHDVFTTLAPGQEGNARAMLDALLAAHDEPNYEFDINVSKTSNSVKGLEIKKPDGTTELQVKDETIDYLMYESLGYVGTSVTGATVLIKTARAFSDKKSASDKLVSAQEAKSTSEIAVLQISNKKALIEDAAAHAYWQDITPEIEEQTGCKSALTVKCIKKQGDQKEVAYTYRLPLTARMHKQEVTDAAFLAKFGKPTRVGKVFDMNNPEDIKKQEAELTKLISLASSSGITENAVLNSVRNAAAASEAAADEQVAADFQ